MSLKTPSGRRVGVFLTLGFVLVSLQLQAPAVATEPITVAQATGSPTGTAATVRGYVVGQPTATPYFSHPGLKSVTTMSSAGGTDPDPTGDPEGYYDGTSGLEGAALEAKLHTIITVQTKISYDSVWDALMTTDQDPANPNNVILLYTGRSQSKAAHGGGVNDWNREHVWAKSHGDFGTATGPGTDVHHLRPTDVTVNSARGNLDFDEGGSESTEAPGNFGDSDSWEPRDEVKGDVARMIFYMSVRYEGGDGWADLEVNDQVSNGSNPNIGRLSVLLKWSAEDPPSTFEKRRNDVIFDEIQHNRNPFIDHPEWAASIWAA